MTPPPTDAAHLRLVSGDPATGDPLAYEPPAAIDGQLLDPDDYGDQLTAGTLVDPAVEATVNDHLIPIPRTTITQHLTGLAAGERQPILPASLKDKTARREVSKRAAGTAAYSVGYATVRSPWWLLVALAYAVRGAAIVWWKLTRWVLDVDGHPLTGDIRAKDDKAYVAMARDRSRRQRARATLLTVLSIPAGIGMLVAYFLAPHWVWPVLGALVAVRLALYGRPAGKTITSPAIRKDRALPLTDTAIINALNSCAIAALSKALAVDPTKIWRSSIAAVTGGHRVDIQMPPGVLAVELVPHEQRLAGALGRQADCVVVELLPGKTPQDLTLHVLDKPVLANPRGGGPLVRAKKANWYDPVKVGLTRLGQAATLHLRGGAWFLGGEPGAGKSSLLKIAAAHTALDPNALLTIVNLKGSPDYVGLKPVCHRYLSGSPETDPTVVPATMGILRDVLADCARRNDLLSGLVERGQATSTDVTEDLSRAHPLLRPHTVIIDEAHRLFDESDNPQASEAADLYARAIKAVRSAGITLIGATQLAGTESIPPAVSRAARVRGCLKVQDEVSFRQIFGNAGRGAFSTSGVATLPRGVVILKAEDGASMKVGTYLIDTATLADIGRRALALRTAAETLTGQAAGQVDEDVEPVDPAELLEHILVALPAAAPARSRDVAWLGGLEAELADAFPSSYVDRAEGWLSGELKARAVATRSVNRKWVEDGEQLQRTAVGVDAKAVTAALALLADRKG